MGRSRHDTSNYKKQSYGRDGTSGTGNLKSVETSSSRGIVYPKDIELQGGDSDENLPIQGPPGAKLGLRPAVRTEIGVGASRAARMEWSRPADRRIEVKTDFVVTDGKY